MHEGIDLGWRLMDAGWRLAYAGDVVARHPAPTGRPHRYSYYFGARNRVWLARRHLPLPHLPPADRRDLLTPFGGTGLVHGGAVRVHRHRHGHVLDGELVDGLHAEILERHHA